MCKNRKLVYGFVKDEKSVVKDKQMSENNQAKQGNFNAEKLKQSALKNFGLYGYGSTTVRMIAKDAGLSAGQITVHYGSKEGLYKQIVDDIINEVNRVYDPYEEKLERLLDQGEMTRDIAWEMIGEIIDLQIEYCLNPDNRDKIMMTGMVLPDSEKGEQIVSGLNFTVNTKIEKILAQLIQIYSKKKGYLRSRTISRAVNGSIVSFGEHNNFLLDEVYGGTHSPQAIGWLKQYLKSYIRNSIRAADMVEEE